MRGKIRKWGNSFGIRIQKSVAEQLHIGENTEVLIDVEENRIVVTPLAPKKTLQSMMEGVTPENIHEEIDFGSPVGNEVW